MTDKSPRQNLSQKKKSIKEKRAEKNAKQTDGEHIVPSSGKQNRSR